MKLGKILFFVLLELLLMIAVMAWATGLLMPPIPEAKKTEAMRSVVSGDVVIWTAR